MSMKWNIRMIMAANNIWTGAELQRRLEKEAGLKISKAGISRLLNEEQTEIKLKILDALCLVLQCNPSDLLMIKSKKYEMIYHQNNMLKKEGLL